MLIKNKKLIINIIITVCYAIFTLLISLHHEIWRDEAQVWLLLKHSNFAELVHQLINEGHPPLFYLLVMPFVKLHFNVFAMQFVCWIFSAAGIFLLLNFSPFKWWVNLAIILSAGFIYDFPVIARGYSLLPFLVFWAASLYSASKEHPILYSVSLLLISQTHYLMFGFVFVLTGVYIYDCVKNKLYTRGSICGLLILISSVFFTLFRSIQTIGNNYFIDKLSNSVSEFFIQGFGILYHFLGTALSSSIHNGFLITLVIYFILLLTVFIRLFIISKKSFVIAFFGIAFQFYVYIKYYPDVLFVNRVFTAYLILIFACWIAFENNNKTAFIKNTEIIMAIFFIMTAPNGLNMCFMEYNGKYSAGKETAEYIVNNIDKDAIILTDTLPMTEAVCVYLPDEYKIYNAITGKAIKYVIWKQRIKERYSKEKWKDLIDKNNLKDKKVYILQSTTQATKFDNSKIKFISSKSIMLHEQFVIQEYKG